MSRHVCLSACMYVSMHMWSGVSLRHETENRTGPLCRGFGPLRAATKMVLRTYLPRRQDSCMILPMSTARACQEALTAAIQKALSGGEVMQTLMQTPERWYPRLPPQSKTSFKELFNLDRATCAGCRHRRRPHSNVHNVLVWKADQARAQARAASMPAMRQQALQAKSMSSTGP